MRQIKMDIDKAIEFLRTVDIEMLEEFAKLVTGG